MMGRRPKQTRSQSALLLAVCVVGAAGYAWFAIRAYLAERLADRSGQSFIERAVAIAPQNADYHDLLCRSMNFASQEPERAVEECRKASELNPYSSSIWLDLARAYYSVGKNKLSTVAVRKALAVDPTTPDTAWNAANFFLIQGDVSEALREFGLVLREEPSLAPAALNVCWQSLHDIHLIEGILPPNPEVYFAFIKLLLSTGEPDAAHQIWSALMQLKTTLDYHLGLFYIDHLLQAHLVAEASDAWRQLSLRSKALQAYSESDNLIMDGSFAQDILNSGFDWRYSPMSQISVTLDKAEFHTGDRSLRLAYNGSGSDAGIFQYIAVQPGTRYRLSAWVMSEDLSTANGPMLALLDGYTSEVYSSTEETTGTTGWHRVETELQTGPETHLLLLAVLRRPGETRVKGRLWLDDIRLWAA